MDLITLCCPNLLYLKLGNFLASLRIQSWGSKSSHFRFSSIRFPKLRELYIRHEGILFAASPTVITIKLPSNDKKDDNGILNSDDGEHEEVLSDSDEETNRQDEEATEDSVRNEELFVFDCPQLDCLELVSPLGLPQYVLAKILDCCGARLRRLSVGNCVFLPTDHSILSLDTLPLLEELGTLTHSFAFQLFTRSRYE